MGELVAIQQRLRTGGGGFLLVFSLGAGRNGANQKLVVHGLLEDLGIAVSHFVLLERRLPH